MRPWLTIFHYELLMQLKSIRFKATCLLALLIAVPFYSECIRNQELMPLQDSLLSFGALPFFLVAIAFTGLFSIGRIRSSGMHPILMSKPFQTFALLWGQHLAGLVVLLVPLFLLFFPAGLLLHWQYDIEFPFAALLYVFLFVMVPLIAAVLAVTIWVRTCFKSNLVAIIVLALIFAATAWLADRFLSAMQMMGENGVNSQVHRFVPMASYFCKTYWNSQMRVLEQPTVSFTQKDDWLNWAASILYCNVFLMLGGYHLRRTEPQRKVLGSYGRHWYHTPTFLRIACDLKIDPHVTWRHHLVLFAMIGYIALQVLKPMMPADFGNRSGQPSPPPPKNQNQAKAPENPYDPEHFPAEKILQMRVHEVREMITPDHLTAEVSVSVEGPTSGTTAILWPWGRDGYDLRTLTMDGRTLPLVKNNLWFISGRDLDPFADRRPHQLKIEAARSTVQTVNSVGSSNEYLFTRSYFFVQGKRDSMNEFGERYSSFDSRTTYTWPTRLTLLKPPTALLLQAPRPPQVRQEGPLVRYEFQLPANENIMVGGILFDPLGDYVLLDSPQKGVKLRLAVPRIYEGVARDLLELAQPVAEDFCALHQWHPDHPIVFVSPESHLDRPQLFKELRRFQNIYHFKGYMNPYQKDQMMQVLQVFETGLLRKVYSQAGGLQEFSYWDLRDFIQKNLTKGLNHRVSLERKYESPDYEPINRHLDATMANRLGGRTREECRQIMSDWPVFQMLYLVLGPEKWQAMLNRLPEKLEQGYITPELVQPIAEQVAGEPLGWFFDYWLRGGKDLPCYQIESATAKLLASNASDQTQYAVKVAIKNLGSGRMPVPLSLTTSKGAITDKVWIDAGATATWTMTCKDLPNSIQVDPAGWILTKPYWVEKNRTWIGNAGQAIKIEPARKK